MPEPKTNIKNFKDYLSRSGLINFYESLDGIFILIEPSTTEIVYENPYSAKFFLQETNKTKDLIQRFSPFEQKAIQNIIDKINGKEAENGSVKISVKNGNEIILRFQKVVIGKKELIVVFSTQKDCVIPQLVRLEKNYLNTLYKISKLTSKIRENEEDAFSQIVNEIAGIFSSGTIWIRLKINGKFYVSENFNNKNRIFSQRIKTPYKTGGYMEIGLTEKDSRLKGIYFTVEEEKVFDEIIERIEDALLQKYLHEKLAQNEERYRSIIQRAIDAIIVTDEIGDVIDANIKSEELFGLSKEELFQKNIAELIPEFNHEEIIELLNSVNNSGRNSSGLIEKNIAKKRKQIRVEISVASWKAENKNYFSFFIRDITQRKKNEEQIIYRSKFEQLLARISARFIEGGISNIEKNIEYALKKLGLFLGSEHACVYILDKNKLTCQFEWAISKDKRIIDLSNNLEIRSFSDILNTLTRNSAIVFSRRNAPKKILPFLRIRKIKSVLSLALYNSDDFIGFISFEFADKFYKMNRNDLSLLMLFSKMIGSEIRQFFGEIERRKIESQMRKLQEAIKQSANAIVITDINGNIEYVNPKFEEITKYSFDEVKGKNPKILKSGYTSKEEYEKLWKTITSGKEWKGIFKNRAKDGTYFWENAIITPVFNEKGEITNFLAVKENITENIKMKNQLDLARKMEAIGQLAAGVAHEINTPMQFISDNTEFVANSFQSLSAALKEMSEKFYELLDKETAQKVNNAIEEIKEKYDWNFILEEIPAALEQSNEGIERVTKIIKTLKDFSHPSLDAKSRADINKAINDTVLISRNAWKYVAEMETNLSKEIPPVNCYVDKLNQAILNIIVNAAQAIEEKFGKNNSEKGLIKVETYKEDNFAVIKISDNGIGIPKENLDKIFDPFFTTKEVGKGTGQGLALVHDIIVNKHKGEIYVESEPKVGTVFTIKIPINEEENE